jgi:large subunit ribosomal protein L5
MASRLKTEYNEIIKDELKKELNLSNDMAVPAISKIVVNMGIGEAVTNKTALDDAVEIITLIAGQKPSINKSRKAISAFKLREDMEIGVSVTLRGDRMWEFFDKLVNVVFPRTRDFRGLNPKAFDGNGNYSIGIREHSVFPEIDPNRVQKIRSLQVNIVTTAGDNKSATVLLNKFGFPFAKNVNNS